MVAGEVNVKHASTGEITRKVVCLLEFGEREVQHALGALYPPCKRALLLNCNLAYASVVLSYLLSSFLGARSESKVIGPS